MLVVVFVIGLVYALPNLYGEDPAVQITARAEAPPVSKRWIKFRTY